ncbi:hypothetical protein C8R45DRAFT_936966 [Mycena sanguinolenta]|nr:hypothetical protein C8R45DRAFT_936966 [Mycena sanguinolenta]
MAPIFSSAPRLESGSAPMRRCSLAAAPICSDPSLTQFVLRSTGSASWLLDSFILFRMLQPSGALSASNMFNPEEEDKMFGDPDADLSDDGDNPALSCAISAQLSIVVSYFHTRELHADQSSPIQPMLPISFIAQAQSQFTTPQNLRVFPQASQNVSSTDIQLPLPCKLVRRAKPTYTDLSSASDLSSPTSHLQSPANTVRQPLIHRTNIFGPGLHDECTQSMFVPDLRYALAADISSSFYQTMNLSSPRVPQKIHARSLVHTA